PPLSQTDHDARRAVGLGRRHRARSRPSAPRRPSRTDAHRALTGRTPLRTRPTPTRILLSASLAIALAACSSSSKGSSPASSTTPSAPSTRPAGPAADLSKELTGGKGVFMGEAVPPDLDREGYVQREYEADGNATSYKVIGSLTNNGRWKFAPDKSAPYRTR